MLKHSRIWLFAPFVALFALGVGFFFLWSYAGDEIEARLGAENITWKNVVRAGFPARMTMDFTEMGWQGEKLNWSCLLYTSPSPRDGLLSRMPSSA